MSDRQHVSISNSYRTLVTILELTQQMKRLSAIAQNDVLQETDNQELVLFFKEMIQETERHIRSAQSLLEQLGSCRYESSSGTYPTGLFNTIR